MARRRIRRRPRRKANRRFRRRIHRGVSQGPIYRFQQTLQGGLIGTGTGNNYVQQTGSQQNFAYYFTLSDLTQYTTFTGLFDQYRIDKVRITFTPTTVAVSDATVGATQPQTNLIASVVDFDDASALSTYAQYQEYRNYRSQGVYCMKPHVRTFKPHIAANVYGAGAFGAFANLTNTWLDCASAAVQYYGLKFVIPGNAQSTAYQTWIVEAKYWVSFKNVR